MNNDFSEKTKDLFIWLNYCILCGETTEELSNHHIMGRSEKYNNSPLNLARVCGKCHDLLHGMRGKEKELIIATLLVRTFVYLNDSGYLLNESDEKFYSKNEEFYKMFNQIL